MVNGAFNIVDKQPYAQVPSNFVDRQPHSHAIHFNLWISHELQIFKNVSLFLLYIIPTYVYAIQPILYKLCLFCSENHYYTLYQNLEYRYINIKYIYI